jgi:metal-responsive CopG/Arc/MetJ family transcriptional regulator
MLSEDIVAAVDRLAYESGTNRSNMINNILAEYVSYRTPEMRMRSMFETMENLLSACEGFKVMLRSSDSLFSLRSALTFKYNPRSITA